MIRLVRRAIVLAAAAGCVRAPAAPAPETAPDVRKDSSAVMPAPQPPVPSDTARVTAPPDTVPRDTSTVRVCAGGDVMLGNNLDTTWVIKARRATRRRIPALPRAESLLAPLRPIVASAEVVLLNIEGAIGEGPAPKKCGRRSRACYAFRQPSRTAAALRTLHDSAVIVGNLANNHARDAGPAGYARTRSLLEDAGIAVTGADSVPTIVTTARGDTILFLGFGTNWPNVADTAALRRWVAAAAAIHPRIVVTMHLGAEGPGAQRTRDTTEIFVGADRGNPVAFARVAIESGARLLVGHGPHVMRAMEWRDSAFVAYSLGNLVTYGTFTFSEPGNRGGILCAAVAKFGPPREVVFHPTRQVVPGRVARDPSGRAAEIVDSLSVLDFPASGARLERADSGWLVRRPQ